MSRKSFKESSRISYLTEGDNPTTDELQLGCLQRIADATELMAKPFIKMVQDLEWYSKERTRLLNENDHLKNRIAGHKAAYTKLKNKSEDGEKFIEEFCKENDLCPICITGGWNCGSDHK